MQILAFGINYSSGLPLVVYGGVAMYIASKALADGLVAGRDGLAGRLAVGQWLPIAALAVYAAVTQHQSLAIGLVFSTTVACLALATGTVGYLGISAIAHTSRRAWAMLLPVGMLTFLAGFRASISLGNAGILALQGLCVLLLWNDRAKEQNAEPSAAPSRGLTFRIAEMTLGFALAGVGSWFAIHGIESAAAGSEFASTGLLAATVLGPLLVLPIIGTGTELSQRNQPAVAIASQMGVALLNLCASLPMIVAASCIRQMFSKRSIALQDITPFPFPLPVWRVDVVMVIALALFLLPVAIGRWSLSRIQGLGLLLGYAVYLTLTVAWHAYSLYGITIK